MTTRRPDLEDLAMLVLVAQAGSIGQAAVELGLSQPSVSRRMTGLERSLRVSLLHRSRRGTTLTTAGRVVVDWASTLLAAADHFTRSVHTLREQDRVAARVAVSMTIAEHHAPGWLATLHSRSPETVVSLSVANSTEVADLVESGQADIGFLESPTVRTAMQRRRVGWDRLIVAVAPDHDWATNRAPITARDLADSRLLVREPGSGTRETIEHAFQRQQIELTPSLVMASNTALKSAAVAGLGAVVVSELALVNEIAAGQLVEVPVAGLDLRRPLTAVWRRGDALGPGATALLRVAHERR